MKIKFYSDNELPLNKTIGTLPWEYLLVLFFMKIINIIHKFSEMNVCIKSKNGK